MPAKLRVPKSQEHLFPARRVKGTAKARTPRVKRRKEDWPENQLEKQVIDFLHAKGFTCVKQHAGLFRRVTKEEDRSKAPAFTIGKKGNLDWFCYRPVFPGGHKIDAGKTCVPAIMFVLETKAPGKKPTPEQMLEIRRHIATGTPATWADSLESFQTWFKRMAFEAWIV